MDDSAKSTGETHDLCHCTLLYVELHANPLPPPDALPPPAPLFPRELLMQAMFLVRNLGSNAPKD